MGGNNPIKALAISSPSCFLSPMAKNAEKQEGDKSESAEGYLIPVGQHRTEDVIKSSRFIATLAPVSSIEDAKDFIDKIKNEFPDATHNVWAYLVGPAGESARVGMSDDGEVRGTAGKPVLNEVMHSGIGDVAIVVTRYYGGTKLGTGGLVRAYGGSAKAALESTPTKRLVASEEWSIKFDYSFLTPLKRSIQDCSTEILSENFADRVEMIISVPLSQTDTLKTALLDMTAGQIEIKREDEREE